MRMTAEQKEAWREGQMKEAELLRLEREEKDDNRDPHEGDKTLERYREWSRKKEGE